MTDEEPGAELTPQAARSAAQTLDSTDQELLDLARGAYGQWDPVPGDLVERIQFAVALDEVFTEVAELTRQPMDTLAVRGESVSGTRTETLTFSADELTVMITVSRLGAAGVRIDGWAAPPLPLEIRVRMPEHDARTQVDESGRFAFEGLPEGFAQLSFHPRAGDGEGVIVTPLFQL
ncbi:MAG: carboxypeptidase regulatory-like domain-containing protein [Nocardioidaceae bacterium]|nr:MAG: carboxypeptidase regulatory-like domain-containing protein [Nocardioidaceae bacterium]